MPSSSYVGSAISIAGNVLIAFALNTQKLAHQRAASAPTTSNGSIAEAETDLDSPRKESERAPLLPTARSDRSSRAGRGRQPKAAPTPMLKVYTVSPETNEITGVVAHPKRVIRDLAKDGTEVQQRDGRSGKPRKKWLAIRSKSQERQRQSSHGSLRGQSSDRSGSTAAGSGPTEGHAAGGLEIPDGEEADMARSMPDIGIGAMARRRSRTDSRASSVISSASAKFKTVKSKLTGKGSKRQAIWKSKLWWFGVGLMALGETGNFTSYAFAPASIVAPLGTTALIANCFIAPCLLHEKFRKKDLLGIALSIVGALAVVLSGRSENKSLSPSEFLHAIAQPAFIVYSSISLGLIAFLITLSHTRIGDKYLAVDILITALAGGFTVLSTKAFSSFLTKSFLDCFKQPITYPILLVLVSTAILQLTYLNRALQRFESRVVVPAQFVSFTISAISGSAVLYRDFENADSTSATLFFTGCVAVFLGVVVLTKGKGNGNGSGGSGISQAQGREERRQRQKQQQQQHTRPRQEDVEANESGISASSTGSAELDGVTLLNDPPPNTNARRQKVVLVDSNSSVRPYPSTAIPGLRQVRKHSSFGTFPTSRSYSGPSSTAWPGNAVATPLARPARMPSLMTTKVFSPGYLLIAGGGFGALEDILSSSNESGTEDDEAGREDVRGRQSSGCDGGSGDEDDQLLSQLEGPATQPDDARHDDSTTMTSSQIMRRSGTI